MRFNTAWGKIVRYALETLSKLNLLETPKKAKKVNIERRVNGKAQARINATKYKQVKQRPKDIDLDRTI